MNIDNENFNDDAAFIESMTDIFMRMLEVPLREMLDYCFRTNCSKGISMLLAVVNEFKFE